MVWGIFPILLATKGFTLAQIGIVTAIYPAVWGLGQLFTGKMADRFCKKDMLYIGMFLQAIALLVFVWANTMPHFVILSSVLGWGTAMVYPTFLATVAENTNPQDRARYIQLIGFHCQYLQESCRFNKHQFSYYFHSILTFVSLYNLLQINQNRRSIKLGWIINKK